MSRDREGAVLCALVIFDEISDALHQCGAGFGRLRIPGSETKWGGNQERPPGVPGPKGTPHTEVRATSRKRAIELLQFSRSQVANPMFDHVASYHRSGPLCARSISAGTPHVPDPAIRSSQVTS
jgi:hypothetical protein